jgi:malonyl-CoA O-methyltransferase
VGKTLVSACLVRRWGAEYWKPVQTGLADEVGDTSTVMRLADVPAGRVHAPRFELAAPLSPEAAATREAVTIRLEDFALPAGEAPIVVEGAGGVLVPLCAGAVIADLIGRLGLPVVLVARSTLGTINHTLLSVEALRARGIAILGVVMVGDGGEENAAAIARFGRVRLVGTVRRMDRVDAAAVNAAAAGLPGAEVLCGGAV